MQEVVDQTKRVPKVPNKKKYPQLGGKENEETDGSDGLGGFM